jgi:hypothetical protein
MPIDNHLPLPDNNLSDKSDKNIHFEYGYYKMIPYCKDCRYFSDNELDIGYRSRICPNCGSITFARRIACLHYRVTRKKFLFWTIGYHKDVIGISLKRYK